MKKIITFFFTLLALFTIHYSLITSEVLAHCPLCTAGAGAGLALSRWLGIDDSISGVWIAAFLGASALWGANSLKKKYIPFQSHIIYWVVIATTIWSFYAFKLADTHAGLIMGIPKVIFGMGAGSLVFYLVDFLNSYIRKVKGKVLFAYQPIVFSLGAMVIVSASIFIFINYYI